MKKQIVIIGGGNAFEKYEDYLHYLNTRPLDLDSFRTETNWKNSLQARLGNGYDVVNIRMPNKDNARYAEWKVWFERIIQLLSEDVIFIGHSLGGLFLAKYLSENVYPKKISCAFLLAAPFLMGTDRRLVDFVLGDNLQLFKSQSAIMFIYHSEDDPVVPVTHAEMYAKELPYARRRTFSSYGHLNQVDFPEIIEDIRECMPV
jgi:predicted alpha/beta hydrolase family esterase